MNYYNEWDHKIACWLKEIIHEGLIADGEVDERDIREVPPNDLKGFRQCHLFSGVGGWAYALRLAGVPDDYECWTGSPPCQPFSVAGQRKGCADERHLWPSFRWLIAQRRPPIVFGEQVAGDDGREWFAGVRLDMELMGYEVGGADLCAASFAPHIRQRLFWVADFKVKDREVPVLFKGSHKASSNPRRRCGSYGMGDSAGGQREQCGRTQRNELLRSTDSGATSRLPDCQLTGLEGSNVEGGSDAQERGDQARPTRQSCGTSHWEASYPHLCLDGKYRRVPTEPSLFPLAPRVSGSVVLLRGSGNSIVPPLAAKFIEACGVWR